MRKKISFRTIGKKGLLVLAGIVGLNIGIMAASMPDVQAYASYESMAYYSDVVKASATANAVEPESKVEDSAKNMIIDHTECWGTRDCVEVTMPEDGTLKIHMKNTSQWWMYGGTLEVYADKNLTYKLDEATISVDGGGEADSSIYLEKGTYYIYVYTENYDGNEFVKGEPQLQRQTQVWVGYVAQAPIFSVKSVELSEDKTSATVTLNLPESYSTLRVEDGYIDYEQLKNGTRWETDTRTNMIEYDTYTVKKNGWYTFRLALKAEDKTSKGWGYLCHVKVSGIGGKEYQELGASEDNLPEITVGEETKSIPSIINWHDLKQHTVQGDNLLYSVHAYKQTRKTLPLTIKEAGTVCFTGASQARQGTYNATTLTLYADKACKMKINSTTVSGTQTVSWSLIPGTYYLKVTTAENSSELNGTDYAERSFCLYGGYIASKEVMSQDITLSEDKKSATIHFNWASALKGVTYYLYDYKVPKWQLSNKAAGESIVVKDSTLTVTENGEYTVYIGKTGSKDHPSYYLGTFQVNGIRGEEYKKEIKSAPSEGIPYAHSLADLVDNIAAEQKPFISIPYAAWDVSSAGGNTSAYKKVVFERDTYIHTCTSGTGGSLKIYKDFQGTDLYKSMNGEEKKFDNARIEAGTYYMIFQANAIGVGSTDGAYYYAQADLYIGGEIGSDMVTLYDPEYNDKKTEVTYSLNLEYPQEFKTWSVYYGHCKYENNFDDNTPFRTLSVNKPLTITKNGEYTIVVYPKNSANIGKEPLLFYLDVEDLNDSQKDDQNPDSGQGKDDTQNPDSGQGKDDTQNPDSGQGKDDTQNPGSDQNNGENQNPGQDQQPGSDNNANKQPDANQNNGGVQQPGTNPGQENGNSAVANQPGTGKDQTTGQTDADSDEEDALANIEVKKGSIVTVKGLRYKVTSTSKKATVCLVGADKTVKRKVVIPDRIAAGGKSFAVTAIAKNALKGNKKITSITIGKNVTKIGKNAMRNCKNLCKLDVRCTNLKSIGSNAFAGMSGMSIYTPKKKNKKYMKMLTKAGILER